MKGQELKELRLSRRLSVDDAAGMVGVSARTWLRWEAGNDVPKPTEKLFKVQLVLMDE